MRTYTKKLMELIDNGILNADKALNMCLDYLSEEDVKNMMEANQLTDEEWGENES